MKGDVIANASVSIPNGYQLLYSNPTLPGMSGGAVMNAQGQLVGIHAGAERADQISESSGKAVATGTNQAVPIAYYSQYSKGAAVVASSTQANTADDYLAQVKALLGKKGSEQEVIRLTNQMLTTRQSAEAYFYRAYAKSELGDMQGAITDYSQAIAVNPSSADSYSNRAKIRFKTGKIDGAISDIRSALRINPDDGLALFDLAWIWKTLGDSTRMCEALTAASGLGVDRAKAPYQKYCDFSSSK